MNQIEEVRKETQKYFDPASELLEDDVFHSPNQKYWAETRSYRQNHPEWNAEVTRVEVFKNNNELVFSFLVNEGTFYHSWITKNKIDYLLCAEDLCGGQTVLDLTNQKMASYTANKDGFIWTKHLLSPDEKLLAVFGCGWGSPFFVVVYDFSEPMVLPLPIVSEPEWTGFDMLAWVDNRTLKVSQSETEIEIIKVN